MISRDEVKDPNNAIVSTLSIEKEVNTFFRLKNIDVIENLREVFPELSENPGMKEVFLKLRELRNEW